MKTHHFFVIIFVCVYLLKMEDELSNVKEKLEVSDVKCGLLTDECNKLKHQLEGLLHIKEVRCNAEGQPWIFVGLIQRGMEGRYMQLMGRGHACLDNFSTDQMVINLPFLMWL